MDAYFLLLMFVVLACFWSLMVPVHPLSAAPDADDLIKRQAQIDRANHVELL